MNESKSKDFFPEPDERNAHSAAPNIYKPYRNNVEDYLHEERLKKIEVGIVEKLSANSGEESGELPFDEDTDRRRWDNLEKDFDRVFNEAAKQ